MEASDEAIPMRDMSNNQPGFAWRDGDALRDIRDQKSLDPTPDEAGLREGGITGSGRGHDRA